ncbi:MAG: alpha/beta fold hydrolase [Candidatus Hermodarchaeota archaeon]
MPYFINDGVKIYYEIEGEGPPVVMIHSLTSNLEKDWIQSNWVKTLKESYRLILLDCRGHGRSDKPHDASSYGLKMADDIVKLMKSLSFEKFNIFGYSMGANIAFWILLTKSNLLISAILGGLNISLDERQVMKVNELNRQIIEALKADNIIQVKKPMARSYRKFAESSGNDLLALAALFTSILNHELTEIITSPALLRETLKDIHVPVMTVLSSGEIISGGNNSVVRLIPDACNVQIQGTDHFKLKSDPKFHMIVKAFLNYANRNELSNY